MRISSDDPLVAATARLLAAQPGLSNLELVRRLAATLGEDVVGRVPVNRFQRQVRDPALKLLRSQRGNGAARATRPSPTAGRTPERNGRTAEAAPRDTGSEPPSIRLVDEQLVEAFMLGASWESEAEGIAAFRKLDELRRRVRARLGPGS